MAKEKEYFPENKKNKLITSISEAERQRNAVRAMYEGTEKWLKAPNGKQTNLTEEQWVAIRTPNFKRWFGNWDYDGNKKIAVTEIDAKDLPFDYKNDKELRGWLQENLSGKSVRIADDGMITKLSNAGLRASMKRRGEENRSIYTKLEEIIKKSAYFDFENSDGKIKHQFLKGQDIYYSAVKIGDEYYSVKIKLDVNKASLNSYYKDHKVSEIKIAPLVIQTEAQKRTSAQERAIDTLNISQLAGGVKPSFSQVIDENGEPLVVYHGTDKHFDTFNRSEAIFFSKSVDYAESMAEERDGDVVYKTFLNIRNPLPVLQLEEDFSDPVKEVPFIEKAKNDGYDGICFSNDTKNELTKDTFYAAFNPNQIKSATDNNGNFDINNESILFQVIGEHRDQSNEKRNVALEQTYTQGGKSMPGEQKDLYISEEQALRIQLAREIKQNMPNLTDGERAAAIAILEAGAASQKMSLTDYVQQTFPNGVFGDYEKAQNAAHQQGVEINGAVSVSGFGANARAVIYASKTADFSTWCHELSHIWQAQLTGTLKSDAEKAFQVQNGNWQESIYTFADGHTDTSAEAFAYGFEDFLKHKAGEMATKDKKAIFEKFADYMSRTYNGVKQNIEMSEEIAKVYEQFVQLDDNILAEAEKAVRMEKDYNLQLKNKDLYEIFKLDADCDKKIDEVINATDSGQNEKVEKELGKLSDGFVALAARNGEDLEGYSHSIDSYFIKHDRKRHGISKSEVEHERGQVAITDDDIRKIPSVLESPDYIVFGAKNRQHNSTIIYVKNMEDGSSLYVEEERTRSKHLAANTFYKLSAASDATSISRIPALYVQNDHGSIKIIDVKNEIVNIQNNPILFQSAYHGSGASFERFNTAQYGFSGEGSMSFGWGTYLTSSEDIARDYAIRRTSFTNKIEELQQKYPDSYPHIIPIHNNMSVGMSFEDAKKAYIDYLKENHIKGIRQVIKNINEFTEDDFTVQNTVQKRNLYSVEIPDGNYLQWESPVSDEIRTAVYKSIRAQGSENFDFSMSFWSGRDKAFTSGEELYEAIKNATGSYKEASKFLHNAGFIGISYPAGTIHGNGNDATNYVIFNDDDITIKEHLQFQLVGERSIMRMAESEEKERIIADLQAAKLMESKYAGMDAAAKAARIRFATGWEKSADGRWKYELDDSKNRIKSGTLFQKILSTHPQMLEQLSKSTALTLDDIMEAPELFNVFPFMKNVRVSFYSDPNAFRAVLTPEGIKINTQYLNEVDGEKGMKGVLAHEIQHVIQAVEYSSSNGLHGESIELLYNDMQNAIKAAGTNRYDYDLTSLQEGLDEYMHDFGEVEARNVARRISMSYNERRHNTLESTEDVDRNLQFQIIGRHGAASLDAAEETKSALVNNLYQSVSMSITENPQETKNVLSFSEQVDAVLTGKHDRFNALKVCDTPELLFQSGLKQLPMLYTARHLREAIQPKDLHNHTHGIKVEQIKQLPKLLAEPVMIYDSLSRSDSVIVLTSEFDPDKMPIVVSIRPDGKGTYELEKVDSNFVTSVYGRENFERHINAVINNGNLLYWDKEKSQALFSVLGQQLPKGLNNLDPNKILHQTNSAVNNKSRLQGEKTMAPEKQIIAEIGFADGEIRQYEDSVPFLKDLNEATRENAYDTTFRVYADSDELKQKAADVKLDNYDPIEAAERMYNGYEWNDVEHEAVQFTQSAEGRRLLKDAENGRLTMLDARDILDAVEKNGMTLRYDPLPNSYVVDGWTAADGEKLDNYVVSMSELKRLARIEISENSQQNQIQEKKTARTPEEEQAYQEWLEMLDDNQQAEDRMERMQGLPPEEQKPLPEWQQRLNATINQAAEMDGVKDSLKAVLYENAENFNAVSFSRDGYERLFPNGEVQSPIETIKFAENQFDVEDKDRFMLAAYQTLSNPDLIYSETENTDNLESKNYVKTFVFGEDEKSALDIVVKTIDGEKVMISAQKRSLDDLIEHIKQPDQLIFMSEEIKQTIDRHFPEEKQRLKDVLPKLRIVPENTAYDKEKAIATARNFAAEKRNVALEKKSIDERFDILISYEDKFIKTEKENLPSEITQQIKDVERQIEEYWYDGTIPKNARFTLPTTQTLAKQLGCNTAEISIPVAVIKKARDVHNFSALDIKKSLTQLYNPVIVFDSDKSKSESKADSRLILTDSFKYEYDANKAVRDVKPIAFAVNVDSTVDLNNRGLTIEVQDVRSIHDRTLVAKNGTDLIQEWTKKGLCRSIDDKKIGEWSTVAGIYFPLELLNSPKNNILTKTEIVNSFESEKSNVTPETEQKAELDSAAQARDSYNKKYPTDWQIYTKELTDRLNAVSEQIENYLKYGTLPENSRFILPNSPQFMQKIGSHDTQISLPVAVVKKAHETHGLTVNEIQDAVKKLYNPVVVFDSDKLKSENKVDSKLILTDSFTSSNKPVALAMNINSSVQFQKDGHRMNFEVQDIRSIHDRTLIAKNGTDLIKKWTQDGLCRYVDDKKISDWSTVAGIYFPIEALQSPKNNILTKTEIVNSFGKENTPKENIPQEIKKEVTADRLNTDSKEKSQSNKKYTPKEYLKYRSEQFLKHLDQGNLPFMKGEQVGDDIIIKVKAVRNASNGRALTGFQQLMAQDIINTMVENKEIPRMDYEIITYEQAKEAGTFIKKGSPHFMLPVYNEKTNTVFNQIYYFKSGCNEPGKVDLLKLKIQRESFIGRERTKLEKAMKERDVPLDEKNKIFSSIAENHQAIIQYLNSVGKRKEAQEYKNNIPREERAVFDRLEEKKEIELNEMLRKNAEYQHRIEEEEFKRQKENPNLFNARETSSYEDFLGKTMAAMSIGGIVVTSKSTIDTVRSTLTPVLKQSFDQYDYMKGFQIGEVANGKCKENLRETRNNSRENQEIKQTLDKALGFQHGGRNSPPDRSKEIDGYDR